MKKSCGMITAVFAPGYQLVKDSGAAVTVSFLVFIMALFRYFGNFCFFYITDCPRRIFHRVPEHMRRILPEYTELPVYRVLREHRLPRSCDSLFQLPMQLWLLLP